METIETKTTMVGGQAVQLERRECFGCKVPFWTLPTSEQLFHSSQCGEDGKLANRNWRKQWADKLATIKRKQKEQAAARAKERLNRAMNKIDKKVKSARSTPMPKIESKGPFTDLSFDHVSLDYAAKPIESSDLKEFAQCLTECAHPERDTTPTSTKLTPVGASGARERGDPSEASSSAGDTRKRSSASVSDPWSTAKRPESRPGPDTTPTSRDPAHEPGFNGTNCQQRENGSLTESVGNDTGTTQRISKERPGSVMELTGEQKQRSRTNDGRIENALQRSELSTLPRSLPQVESVSLTLIDDALESLKSVMKSATASATNSAGSSPNVAMINSVCNVTKQIGSLVRLKLEAVRLMRTK